MKVLQPEHNYNRQIAAPKNIFCGFTAAVPEGLTIVLGASVTQTINYVTNNTFCLGGHAASSIFKKYVD